MSLHRRQVLKLPFAVAFSRAPLLGGIGFAGLAPLLTLPRRVQADPITIGLAVGSAIAGLVAAHNRSDGGMGAMFKATLEYQRVLARQLDSLQQGMADLLSKVNGLPKEIQSQLYAERLSRLHTTLGAAVLRYRQEAIVRASTFASYQAWLANDNTRNALVAILGDVDRAIAEVVQGRWIDASTCMYLPAVLYTSLGKV